MVRGDLDPVLHFFFREDEAEQAVEMTSRARTHQQLGTRGGVEVLYDRNVTVLSEYPHRRAPFKEAKSSIRVERTGAPIAVPGGCDDQNGRHRPSGDGSGTKPRTLPGLSSSKRPNHTALACLVTCTFKRPPWSRMKLEFRTRSQPTAFQLPTDPPNSDEKEPRSGAMPLGPLKQQLQLGASRRRRLAGPPVRPRDGHANVCLRGRRTRRDSGWNAVRSWAHSFQDPGWARTLETGSRGVFSRPSFEIRIIPLPPCFTRVFALFRTRNTAALRRVPTGVPGSFSMPVRHAFRASFVASK
ncbi:MAG: hypothetical protein CMK54_05840 [Proteobacteria bacterium]|nr:hypothetical protein [Pseudomonadota bacterium]